MQEITKQKNDNKQERKTERKKGKTKKDEAHGYEILILKKSKR